MRGGGRARGGWVGGILWTGGLKGNPTQDTNKCGTGTTAVRTPCLHSWRTDAACTHTTALISGSCTRGLSSSSGSSYLLLINASASSCSGGSGPYIHQRGRTKRVASRRRQAEQRDSSAHECMRGEGLPDLRMGEPPPRYLSYQLATAQMVEWKPGIYDCDYCFM